VSVPDYISPVVGYRAWQWDASGLRSLCGEPWHPGRTLAAGCKFSISGLVHQVHDAPLMSCTCGIYAAKSQVDLRTAGYTGSGIQGEVLLWGTLVEHELGWRAQYACPKNFFLPLEMLPISLRILQPRLKRLTAYGCDIYIVGSEGNMPLWVGGSGYEASTLDLLVQRCKNWYVRRRQERRIKCGDRVAILDSGIAVVEGISRTHVDVLLRNRTALRIGRKQICWNEGNVRWEARLQS
jgi:hypothetical protein